MLPDPLRGPIYCGRDTGVNLLCRALLQAGQDVAIQVERYGDCRVAKPFLRDLRMNARRQEVSRVGMPKIMESGPVAEVVGIGLA